MFLNIITPCSRPENLHTISKSINIPKENYRWIVVCDMNMLPPQELIPNNCEIHLHRNPQSTVGHSQRNFAIDMIEKGHVYQNDDDTVMHPELWDNIKQIENDFISFQQLDKQGRLRQLGNRIEVNHIDSHNFIVSLDTVGETRFIVDRYNADGYFASECYSKSKSPIYINKPLSIYNKLR
jgi:hypothetical protein